MKKFVSVMMAMLLVLSVFAGCGSKTPAQTPQDTTEAVQETTEVIETTEATQETQPAETAGNPALTVLQTIWNAHDDSEKFSVYGGNPKENFEDNTLDQPDVYDLADENISFNLLIPAEQLVNVASAASMTHMMNSNNFNAAVYQLAEGADVQAFCEAMYQAVSGNMWMCGMPDRVIVAAINTEFVLVVYGVNDALNPFETHLGAAYPDAVIAYNESLV